MEQTKNPEGVEKLLELKEDAEKEKYMKTKLNNGQKENIPRG